MYYTDVLEMLKNNIISSVHIKSDSELNSLFDLEVYRRRKSKLINSFSYKNIDSTIRLLTLIPPKSEVIITITGPQILHKNYNKSGTGKDNIAIDKIIPGIDLDTVNVQKNILQNNEIITFSVIKKNIIDELVSLFIEAEIIIRRIYLGPFSILNVIESNQTGEFSLECCIAQISNNEIIDISYEEKEIKAPEYLEILKHSTESKICFSTAIEYIINNGNLGLYNEKNSLKIADINNKKSFYKKVKYIILFLVLLIVIDRTIYYYYRNKIKNLTTYINVSNTTHKNEIKERENDIEISEIVKILEIEENNHFAYTLNAVVTTIPKTISLLSLRVNPIEKLNNMDSVSIYPNKICFIGSCDNNDDLISWINEIKAFTWVKYIKDIVYKYNPEIRKGQFEFNVYY